MTLRATLLSLLLLCGACREEAGEPSHDVPVRVSIVALDAQNVPVVILEEESGARVLPIWIGSAEASSIAAEIHKQKPPRPNSHDFAARLIQGLEGELLRVIVTEIRDGTFYAILVLEANGKRVEIDARPSDAIATALRAGAPILVRDHVFEQAGETPPDGERRESIAWPGAPPATRAVGL
jgi:bifunctional DNase/RNase